MIAEQRVRGSARCWIRGMMPASVVILIVGPMGTVLYRAVEKARNAARVAATT
jgi:hypothetical protein